MPESSEKVMPSPERRILPLHIAPEFPKERQLREQAQQGKIPRDKLPHELFKTREAELAKAEDFDTVLREEYKEAGLTPPENKNLALLAVETFQRLVHETQDFRRIARSSSNPAKAAEASVTFAQKRKKVGEFLSYGPVFESAYREYIRQENKFIQFLTGLKQVTRLEETLEEPSFKDLDDSASLDERAYSRVEAVMRESKLFTSIDQNQEIHEALESLDAIFPNRSRDPKQEEQYQQLRKQLLGMKPTDLPKTKGEVREELDRTQEEVAELWEDPMVRYFWENREFDKLLRDFSAGKDVLEMQSTIAYLNKLHEWEKHHQRTTIGGVLVGPPGVGKTTLLRHYLEAKDRNYVYIDLSEDVTRYLLYGSKAIELQNPADTYKALAETIKGMKEPELRDFISQNTARLKSTLKLSEGEATVLLINQLEEKLKEGNEHGEDVAFLTEEARQYLAGLANTVYHRELGKQFAHLLKHNGWRDGMIIAGLRRGDSIILDEFHKFKDWSLLYSLATAKPGEKWYFADNDEHIEVPKTWRMYFTANIGRRHGGFKTAEALASRAQGKVIEMDYPPMQEEMKVALASCSDAEGNFLRSVPPKKKVEGEGQAGENDLGKLYWLVAEIFPKIRSYIQDKPYSIPISFRTIRDLGEKLVLQKDPKSGIPVFQPINKTFDEAIYEVLVESYALYEEYIYKGENTGEQLSQTGGIQKEIVDILTLGGLLLSDSAKAQVTKWIGEDKWKERKEKLADKAEEGLEEIARKIRGETPEGSEQALTAQPSIRKF